jgi:Domain of unknown function (DUF4260)
MIQVAVPTTITQTLSLPNMLLRGEGAAVLLGALALYANQGGSWVAFILLLLVPDVVMLGYLINPRVGAVIYNIGHFYALPGLLLALSWSSGWAIGIQLALIWLAHIGMDRLAGYGLKYATDFKDSHLQRV